MHFFPHFQQITNKDALQNFAQVYQKCSGLPIPEAYLYNSKNCVFGIYWKGELIGGFILGGGPKFRTKTSLNFFIWFAMAYALKRYGTPYFLFGTCSRSLARLYGQTAKSVPIHQDHINGKATFIF